MRRIVLAHDGHPDSEPQVVYNGSWPSQIMDLRAQHTRDGFDKGDWRAYCIIDVDFDFNTKQVRVSQCEGKVGEPLKVIQFNPKARAEKQPHIALQPSVLEMFLNGEDPATQPA